MPSATSRKEVPVLMQRQIKKRKTGKAASAEAEPTSAGDLDKETVDAITQKRCMFPLSISTFLDADLLIYSTKHCCCSSISTAQARGASKAQG